MIIKLAGSLIDLNIKLLIFFFATILLAGCSTGPYLKPHAEIGWYSTENPACPGAEEVLEFSLANYDWLIFRVLAKQPTKWHPDGTKLIAYVRPLFHKHPDPNRSWSMFPSQAEKRTYEALLAERISEKIEIFFSESYATIILSDGSELKVELPFFQKLYKLPSDEYYGIWGPEALISPNKLEDFTVIFPVLYVNGDEFIIPPIHFKLSRGRFSPVLNC